MRILVFGAGAIGSAFGGFLSRFHNVTLLGRPWHLKVIRKKGLQVRGIWGRHVFKNFHLTTDAKALFKTKPRFDLILLAVKSYDTESTARFLGNRIDSSVPVLSLQNGVGNIEILKRFLVPSQVLAGRVITGVEISPGKINITVTADKTRIGETTKKRITPRIQRFAQVLSKAEIPTEAVPDVEKYLWLKLAYNVALNPLASLLNVHYGALAESESTRFVMNELIREVYRVARRKKIRLKPSTAEGYLRFFYKTQLPRTYSHHPSMLQDLQHGRRTEIQTLSGQVVKLGKVFGIPTPFNELLLEGILSQGAK